MITRELFDEVKEAMKQGRKVEAIKMVRYIAWDIKQAKSIADLIAASTWEEFAVKMGIKEPEAPPPRTSLAEYPVEAKVKYILYNYKQFEESVDTYVRDAIKSSDTDLTILLRRAADHDWNILNGEHFIVVVIKTKAITPDGVIDLCEYRDQIVMEKP